VHLVLPKRQLFEEGAEQPSAAVTISMGGVEASAEMVRAIQNLVAGSVSGMKGEKVNVIDQHGKTLSAGSDASMAGKEAADRKTEVEAQIAKTIKEMIDGVLGPGKARVNVTAEIDLNRITVQEEKFDPDGQVVRSESTNEASTSESKADDTGGVTATQNIPGGSPAGFQALGSKTGSNDTVTNYEISKSVRTEVTEPGTVKKLAVAVAIDGISAPVGKDGKAGAYTARTAEEMAQLEQLVKTAVGFDAARGDQVSVINVRFPTAEGMAAGEKTGVMAAFDKNDIMRAIELGVLAIVALLVLLFAVRPFLKSLSGGPMPMALAGPGQTAPQVTRLVTLTDGSTQQVVIDSAGEPIALAGPANSDIDQRIDIAKIEGQVKASSVKRVAEFVDRHPEESVAILRTWLHESE
jgi:flagellar M-ring protein FliF